MVIHGNFQGGVPYVQTTYGYEFTMDPLLNKPAFILTASTEIIFSKEDFIVFSGFVLYIFDVENKRKLLPRELWQVVTEGRENLNEMLELRLRAFYPCDGIKMSPLFFSKEVPILRNLILTTFRLN
jgi:hypothetical protein